MFERGTKATIYIDGMMCEHCAKRVEEVLKKISGITKVNINLKDKCAKILYEGLLDDKLLEEKINEQDFKFVRIER